HRFHIRVLELPLCDTLLYNRAQVSVSLHPHRAFTQITLNTALNVSVVKHKCDPIVIGVFESKFYVRPRTLLQRLDRVGALGPNGLHLLAKLGKCLFANREKQIRLVRKVEIDRRRRVLDRFSDSPHRDAFVSLLGEQLARGIQYHLPQLLFFALPSLSRTHKFSRLTLSFWLTLLSILWLFGKSSTFLLDGWASGCTCLPRLISSATVRAYGLYSIPWRDRDRDRLKVPSRSRRQSRDDRLRLVSRVQGTQAA